MTFYFDNVRGNMSCKTLILSCVSPRLHKLFPPCPHHICPVNIYIEQYLICSSAIAHIISTFLASHISPVNIYTEQYLICS